MFVIGLFLFKHTPVMKKTICFATHNENKAKEIREVLKNTNFCITTLKDLGFYEDIPETKDTLKGNAIEKAEFVFSKYGISCFSDDSGLEVDALDDAPGVFSARYAGPERDNKKNIDLLLKNLHNKQNRKARFKTVIAYKSSNILKIFEGVTEGKITETPRGDEGFGYDPVFVPEGFDKTYAEIDIKDKVDMSCRTKAFKKFIDFLNTLKS